MTDTHKFCAYNGCAALIPIEGAEFPICEDCRVLLQRDQLALLTHPLEMLDKHAANKAIEMLITHKTREDLDRHILQIEFVYSRYCIQRAKWGASPSRRVKQTLSEQVEAARSENNNSPRAVVNKIRTKATRKKETQEFKQAKSIGCREDCFKLATCPHKAQVRRIFNDDYTDIL